MINNETSKIKLHFERFEFKYLMTEAKAEKVLETLLANNLEWDPYTENKIEHAYTVTSLYYDSPTLKCYREKIDGLDRRFKLRERIYGKKHEENTQIFYEIKRKKDVVIVKDREIGSPSEEFEYKRQAFNLSPNIVIQYERQALQGKFQDRLRVTFDRELRAVSAESLKDFHDPKPVSPRFVIMEIKYNNTLPAWFSRIITGHELERRPFSKYCAGIEACPLLLLKSGLYNTIDTEVVSTPKPCFAL